MRELPSGEPPVLARDDRADPAAREEHLEILGAVAREHGHSIASADTAITQVPGEPAHARAQLAVGPGDPAIGDGTGTRVLTRARGKQTRHRARRVTHLGNTAPTGHRGPAGTPTKPGTINSRGRS